MKTSPYYSINPTDPDVYHDHINCRNGQQIPPQSRRPGTAGRDRCGSCIRMD